MKKIEILLAQLAEECNETAKECMKALRFGLDDHNPKDPEKKTNRLKIEEELSDLITVANMLSREGLFEGLQVSSNPEKVKKIKHYLNISALRGQLRENITFEEELFDYAIRILHDEEELITQQVKISGFDETLEITIRKN